MDSRSDVLRSRSLDSRLDLALLDVGPVLRVETINEEWVLGNKNGFGRHIGRFGLLLRRLERGIVWLGEAPVLLGLYVTISIQTGCLTVWNASRSTYSSRFNSPSLSSTCSRSLCLLALSGTSKYINSRRRCRMHVVVTIRGRSSPAAPATACFDVI